MTSDVYLRNAVRSATQCPSTGKTIQVYLQLSKTYVETMPARLALLLNHKNVPDNLKSWFSEIISHSKEEIFEKLMDRYVEACLEHLERCGASIDASQTFVNPVTGEVEVTMLDNENADAVVTHLLARGFNQVVMVLSDEASTKKRRARP